MMISSASSSTIISVIPGQTYSRGRSTAAEDSGQNSLPPSTENNDAVKVELTPEARAYAAQRSDAKAGLPPVTDGQQTDEAQEAATSREEEGKGLEKGRKTDTELAEQNDAKETAQKEPDKKEQQEIVELTKRDKEVRAHEQAHLSAAGGLAKGGANYTYETGPDGKRYAVGGEVSIDVSPGKSPEETIIKAQKVKRAALAPAEPSGQDRQVAASATQMEVGARSQLFREAGQGAAEDRTTASAGSENLDRLKNISGESSTTGEKQHQGASSAVSAESVFSANSGESGSIDGGAGKASASTTAALKSRAKVKAPYSRTQFDSGFLLKITA